MRSIRTKILAVVISGLVVITALVSMIAVNMTHGIMHKDADRILNNVAQKEAAYINDALGDMERSATIMGHYAVTELEEPGQLSDPMVLEEYLDRNRRMFREIACNTRGVEGFFLRIDPRHAGGTAGFYCLMEDRDTVRELPVTDLLRYSEQDTKNTGWYYTAVRAGGPVWLDPYFFPGHDHRLISYTVPLYVGSQLLGVVGFDMDFAYLVEKVDEITVYQEGYARLLARDGETPYNLPDATHSSAPHTKAVAALLNGMQLELRADYKDIQRDIRPMLDRIVLAFIVVLALAILYTILVTHRIVRPLKRLTAVAQEMADGKNEVAVSDILVDSKDEVGTLAKVLRGTYERIREYTAYINALAYKDSLTGIKNSTAYTEAVAELDREINCGRPNFGVLVADINNLKQTNDTHGHDVGNELIVHTARILTDTFKNSPVFRIGGDEFAVVLRGEDCANYRTLLEQMDEACGEDDITVCEDRVDLSVSRGVAFFDPRVDHVYQDVFTKADHAMYLHKKESKAASSEPAPV